MSIQALPDRLLAVLLVALAGFVLSVAETRAQGKGITLAAPVEMQENGFLQHILPRFMLKHGVRVTPVAPGADADAELAVGGAVPVFAQGAQTFGITAQSDNPHVAKFSDWLRSEIGLRTVLGFQPDGQPLYREPDVTEVVAAPVALSGNALRGRDASLRACGRCHVIGEINRTAGIGSTPSFAVLRALGDWQERFETFYLRNPHPAFTVIPDVSLPFDQSRPPPIHPITLTLDDLDDIVAFAAEIAPADLGAPIKHQ